MISRNLFFPKIQCKHGILGLCLQTYLIFLHVVFETSLLLSLYPCWFQRLEITFLGSCCVCSDVSFAINCLLLGFPRYFAQCAFCFQRELCCPADSATVCRVTAQGIGGNIWIQWLRHCSYKSQVQSLIFLRVFLKNLLAGCLDLCQGQGDFLLLLFSRLTWQWLNFLYGFTLVHNWRR